MRGTVLLLLLVAGCMTAEKKELISLQEYLTQEVQAGRMTQTYATYAYTQRSNELAARRHAEAMMYMGAGATMMQAPQPIGTRCITTQQGATQQTVCH